MPEQTAQIPQAIEDQPRATDRDLQRSALRDLVALAAECAAAESQIAQKHQVDLDAARVKLQQSLQVAEKKSTEQTQQTLDKFHEQSQQIAKRHDDEMAHHKADDFAVKQRIAADFEKVDLDIKQKLQQASWLADSVLEATQNQLRDESTKAKRALAGENEILDSLENRAGVSMFSYGVNVASLPEAITPTEKPSDADGELKHQRDRAEDLLAKLDKLSLPRLLTGATPYIVGLFIVLGAAAAAQLINGEMPTWLDLKALNLRWREIGIYTGIAVASLVVLGVIIRMLGKAQARKVFTPLRQSLAAARHAGKIRAEQLKEDRDNRRQRAVKKREQEIQAARDKYMPLASKAVVLQDKAKAANATEHETKISRTQKRRDEDSGKIETWKTARLTEIDQRAKHEIQTARDEYDKANADGDLQYQQSREHLQQRWSSGLAIISAPIESQEKSGAASRDWNDANWKYTRPSKFATTIQFGDLEIDLKQLTENLPSAAGSQLQLPETFSLPALLAFPSQSSLLIQHDRDGRERAIQTLQMVMARLLSTQPAGRVRFTILDPVGLGQNFAGFMHLADWDEALVGGRIWTSSDQIEQRLSQLTDHMETVIQKYLRNEFETIDQYNAQAGELAEPYRFLVIADFPVGFSDDSIRRLNSIAASGARCGVYMLIAHDRRSPLPQGVNLDDLIAHSVNLVQEKSCFTWNDEVFKQFPITLDEPPGEERLTEILTNVGQAAKEANRVEVSFDTIAPTDEEFWSEHSDNDLHVPIGRMGATRLQMMRLGRGVAQHGLIAGKTGSGKSTLLHAMITNLAMWYPPDQVEFYLVDFKKGVEFKTYATHELPHARAIAVESDREFGLSVLQRIDAELSRRGEMFRKVGVQDLASYRRSPGAVKMPRTLLVIDEFQEFFSEDDKLAQDSAVLMDRLVRQGRAFGIHVLLGSQTIGGSGGLPRSTLGQMAVRIALQTSEVDSQLILGDNNSAARLLSRPGEAIYNDQGGLVEANSPFQVAWLPDERREQYLIKILERSKSLAPISAEPAAVFEGNAPADIRKNRRLAAILKQPAEHRGAPSAWLGDPVAIKEPTAVTFRRQSGSNVLIIGQQEESAMAMIVASVIGLSAQHAKPNCKFVILDGSPADSALAGVLPSMATIVPNEFNNVEYRATAEAINEIHIEMQRRLTGHIPDAPAIFVIIYGLQRYRALRKSEESFSFSATDEEKPPQPDKQFADILREGPPLGIHVIAWCDTPAAVERTLDRGAMREFDYRILFQMSASDSSNLIDSPAANKLGFYRAIAFSEEQGVLEKFRPYALPEKTWLAEVKEQLAHPNYR